MRINLIFIFFVLLFTAFILSFSYTQESYLPTVIHINKTGKFDKELLLNLRASFGNRKIKTISKDEALELQNEEIKRVMTPYYENIKKPVSFRTILK